MRAGLEHISLLAGIVSERKFIWNIELRRSGLSVENTKKCDCTKSSVGATCNKTTFAIYEENNSFEEIKKVINKKLMNC